MNMGSFADVADESKTHMFLCPYFFIFRNLMFNVMPIYGIFTQISFCRVIM